MKSESTEEDSRMSNTMNDNLITSEQRNIEFLN